MNGEHWYAREAVEKNLEAVEAEINRQYWIFTRCARGQPVNGRLYTERNFLKSALRAIRILEGHKR